MRTLLSFGRDASSLRRLGIALGLAVLCAGCETIPQTAKVDFADPQVAQPAAAPAAQPATGSLFHSVGYRPSFEDRRARIVGDTVTIQIVENVTASQKSTSTANRTSSIAAGITAVPGFVFPTATQDQAKVGATSAADFAGKGGTESANTFSGSITATVAEVLPNGHLVVVGEKQIGVNQNVDVLRFTGSTQVANVRVESKGRGAQNEAQTVGWLTRFFFNVWPF
jgi:flagellar L-ring protein precursor FlgH